VDVSQSHGLDPGEYCRAIEAHLCRKNDGHLIRIVGPAFDVVCRWATRGVPLTIACQGIDQYFERYYATRARRRPVQVQFCEGDVLALYDDWRRSVAGSAGFRTRDGDVETGSSSPSVHEGAGHGTLPAHLERVIARLTVLRGRGVLDDDLLDRVVREVDAIRSVARTLRGAARDQALERLRDLDRQVLAGAGEAIPATDLRRLRDDAERGLAGYRDRLSPDAYDQAVRVATDRLLRAQVRLPELTY
jgi:hypothetical protein